MKRSTGYPGRVCAPAISAYGCADVGPEKYGTRILTREGVDPFRILGSNIRLIRLLLIIWLASLVREWNL